MGSCSLKSGELDRACLAAKACGKDVRENSCRTGKLLMSECVYVINAVAKLHDELSVSSLDTFRDTDNDGVLILQKLLALFYKFIDIKCDLRKINGIRTCAVFTLCKAGSACEPSCIAAHDLNDRDRAVCCEDRHTVADDFLHGSTDVLRCRAVTRCMVRQSEVIVNSLRAADETDFGACQHSVIGKLLDRIHGVISADIDEAVDFKIVKDTEDLVKCLSVLVNFRELETAGSEVSSRCSLEKLLIESVLDMFGEVDVMSLHKAFHTVYHAVDLLVSALLG